ncbi:MAG: hypothetical protein JWN37_828 [Candidatus Nomurabacteria bacterium]|nr:hypothetical protein [Candidatus Nomurabacteria bacterium]
MRALPVRFFPVHRVDDQDLGVLLDRARQARDLGTDGIFFFYHNPNPSRHFHLTEYIRKDMAQILTTELAGFKVGFNFHGIPPHYVHTHFDPSLSAIWVNNGGVTIDGDVDPLGAEILHREIRRVRPDAEVFGGVAFSEDISYPKDEKDLRRITTLSCPYIQSIVTSGSEKDEIPSERKVKIMRQAMNLRNVGRPQYLVAVSSVTLNKAEGLFKNGVNGFFVGRGVEISKGIFNEKSINAWVDTVAMFNDEIDGLQLRRS